MDRSHPPRSGIPTYLGSPGGRAHDRGDGGGHHGDSRSPRPQRSNPHVNNGPAQDIRSARVTRVPDRGGGTDPPRPGWSDDGQTPARHRPHSSNKHVTYAHVKRNELIQHQAQGERTLVGCESTQPAERTNKSDVTSGHGVELYYSASTVTGSHTADEEPMDDTRPCETGGVSESPSAGPPGPHRAPPPGAARSREGDHVTRTSFSDMDYPIRGTMSPLSAVAVKRSVGPVDEVSFVFGRPASPTGDTVVRPAQQYNSAGLVRCMSPSAGRYMTGHYNPRPLSPSSDVLPIRRPGTYASRRVLSPPPQLGFGAAAEPRIHHQGGICCEQCNGCLVELKRQALRLMFPDTGAGSHLAQSIRLDNIGERLTVPESYERWFSRTGQCAVCQTPIGQLKQEAVAMIQSIQLAQTTATAGSIPSLVGSCGLVPQHKNKFTNRKPPLSPYASSPSMPLAAQAQAYLEQNVRAYINPKKYSMMLAGRLPPTSQECHYESLGSPESMSDVSSSSSSGLHPGYAHSTSSGHHHVPSRSLSSPTSPPHVPSAAASFFARAAQKLGKKKKRHHSQDQEPLPALPTFPTNFSDVIRLTPPPAPPCLLRSGGRLQNPGMGKVKVMLKICNSAGSQGEQGGSSFLSPDPRKKQVTVFDPSASGYVTSASRRATTAAPKMFAFDSVFTPDDSLTELCASSLSEIIQAVVAGTDGCLFTYGYSRLGKTYTMIGSDQSPGTLGVMPCAIAWLFKIINEQKDKTGARFSVRVSAVQVTGKEEALRDLLIDMAQGTETTGVGTAPSVYLREDPICGTQLENQSELRAPTAEKAAHYLDAALAARSAADEDEERSSHILFTLNVYQYRIERSNTKAGLPGVAGGRSRLHLIDLGTASKSKDPNNVSLSLSALGNVIMALLNGQRHVPHRDSKIAQLLRDSLGNLSCRTCMIAHVSSAVPHYNETLQVIQLAARVHRMKRRRTKFSSTSSEDSSTDGDVKFRRPYRGLRMGTLREDVLYSSSHSDPDYTSSSEQSCDTVIYIGANGQSLSDRELTDNEGPPRHVPRTNPRLPRRPSGSRSSGDDSDSGRSVRSLESRLPLRTIMSPPPGASMKLGQPPSMPGSPNPGLVKMGHRMGMHTKMSADGRLANTDSAAAGSPWQEKPTKIHCHSSQSKLAKAIHDKQQPLEGEQWIDGPGAAIYPESKASELWVDGPPAFVVQQQPQSVLTAAPSTRTEGHHSRGETAAHHHHHRSDSSSRRVASKKVDAEEQWVDGPKEMVSGSNPSQPMHTCSKTEAPSKTSHPAKCAGVNEKALKQALVKHIMEVKDRPDSTVSVDSDTSMVVVPAESRPASFNSDDQAKSSGSSKDAVDVRSDLKQDASSSPMVSSKKQKLSEQKPSSNQSLSPSPSPALARKCNKMEAPKLVKGQLPGSASPTHRVVQWIKSVATEQKEPSSTQQAQPVSTLCNISMADAETNTEHDSDFERMAEENGVRSDSDDGADTLAVNKCNMILDTSLDSSFDASMLNRESIYEMEVDEHLEHMKTKDGSGLAAELDNETFSSLSCSNHDDVERDHQNAESESLLVQHSKALTESKQTAQLNRHLARGCLKRDVSPALSDADQEMLEVTKPLLSRKPDGASNPNLMRAFEEETLGKMHVNNLTGMSVEAMYVTSDPDFPSKRLGLDEDVQSGKGDGHVSGYLPSPKLGTKNKPPLPAKQSPVMKQSGLPKPSSSPQSSSRSIYCVAKQPAAVVKDSPQKAGKHPTAVSPSLKSKFSKNDKACASSSGTSPVSSATSPVSSATSSPVVSSTKSSPAQKPGSKSQNGSTSKLPSFCSSRTSSPSTKDSKARKKETKAGSGRKLSELVHRGKGNDSDSGNDSGIVAHEKKLLSPYATVTKPRTPSHSSSGHGSDNSTISTEVHPGHSRPCTKTENLHGGTSSGYESMLRDSEATCSSSGHEDSARTRRSRSAPAHSTESSPASSQPSQTGSRSVGSSHRAWVDTRHLYKVKDEPLELKKYDPDEVERLGRRRTDDEIQALPDSKQRSASSREDDGDETESKDRIMMERNGWSFDCKFLMCFSCKSRQRGTDV
ncbi:kinesin-like protein KIF26B isoform X2 [Physella acuta]|uniref:kinesin-like protein KIF26B isoform X2 n=1 Tax=Physella acuta TaxID=109671 RepID=UPI0027DB377D|nr:kinesin-like protein KIF26B isoform X2 [Physella acuta]